MSSPVRSGPRPCERRVPDPTGIGLAIALGFALLWAWRCDKPIGGDDAPVLTVSADTLSFGEDKESLVLTVGNSGGGVLQWRIQPASEDWISVSPTSGLVANDPASVDVRIDREKAPPGSQELFLVLTGGGADRRVVVRALIADRSPVLVVEPVTLDFSTDQTSMVLTVSNGGGGTLHWSIASPSEGWIDVSRREGNTTTEPTSVDVRVDRSRWDTDGTYSGVVVVTSDGGTARVTVRMVVEGKVSPARLSVSPVALAFSTTSSRRNLGITNTGQGVLTWEASSPQPWVSIAPDSGSVAAGAVPAQVVVEVDRSALTPGEYAGSIDVTSSGGGVSVPVTVSVPAPVLSLSARDFDFRSDKDVLTLEIANTGTGDLSWEITHDQSWLTIEPSRGTTGQVITPVTLTAQRRGLRSGPYAAKARLSSNSTAEPVVELELRMQVLDQPLLSASPDSLDFGPDQEDLTLVVANDNNGTLTWQVEVDEAWASFDTTRGELGLLERVPVRVRVRRAGLVAGPYRTRISITSNGGTLRVPLRMEVPHAPRLRLSEQTLDMGPSTLVRRVVLRNTGTGRLTWTATVDVPWCEVSPDGGTTLDELDTLVVTVNRTALAPDSYRGTVTVTSDGGDEAVAVEMQVAATPVLATTADSLDFGEASDVLSLTVSNQGNSPLAWSLAAAPDWVQASPSSGEVQPGSVADVQIRVDRTGLALGLHRAVLAVMSNGGASDLPVRAFVAAAVLRVSVDSLRFDDRLGSITVVLSNRGNIPLTWTARPDSGWLAVEPAGSTVAPGASTAVVVSVQRTELQPGGYTASLAIESNGGERTVPVQMQVAATPVLATTTDSLDFGGATELLSFTVANQGNAPLAWSHAAGADWVQASPDSGLLERGSTVDIAVRVDRTGLAPGSHPSFLAIESNGGRRDIPVRATVYAAVLHVSVDGLGFGDTLDSIAVVLSNQGNIPLTWTARPESAWLAVAPTGGTIAPGDSTAVLASVQRTGLAPREYAASLAIESNDQRGTQTVPASMRVLANRPPMADAGADQTVAAGEAGRLDGRISRDPDGDALTFRWLAPAGLELLESTSPQPRFVAAVPDTYAVVLVVGDGQTESHPDTVVVTVVRPNRAPVADAGNDQTIPQGTLVQLDARGSSDEDGNLLLYSWTSPIGVMLSDASSDTPSFVATTPGTYEFVLVVSDGLAESTPATVIVNVLPGQVQVGEDLPIAFSSNRDGDWDIYLTSLDGETVVKLTDTSEGEHWPKWSPDGREIAFGVASGGGFRVAVMQVESRAVRILTDGTSNDRHPVWSPDGREIAFNSNRDGNFDVFVMDADGSNAQNLTNHPAEEHWRVAWSPDGETIVFSSDRDAVSELVKHDLYTMPVANPADWRRLTTDVQRADHTPSFSPDGSRIAFYSSDYGGGGSVRIVDADAVRATSIADEVLRGFENGWPSWSPDGQSLVVQVSLTAVSGSCPDGGRTCDGSTYDIAVVGVDGSGFRRLTDRPSHDWEPDWRPTVWQERGYFLRST